MLATTGRPDAHRRSARCGGQLLRCSGGHERRLRRGGLHAHSQPVELGRGLGRAGLDGVEEFVVAQGAARLGDEVPGDVDEVGESVEVQQVAQESCGSRPGRGDALKRAGVRVPARPVRRGGPGRGPAPGSGRHTGGRSVRRPSGRRRHRCDGRRHEPVPGGDPFDGDCGDLEFRLFGDRVPAGEGEFVGCGTAVPVVPRREDDALPDVGDAGRGFDAARRGVTRTRSPSATPSRSASGSDSSTHMEGAASLSCRLRRVLVRVCQW